MVERLKIVLLISFLISLSNISLAERFGDITINLQPTAEGGGMHGYFDYRMVITNDSPSKTHNVTIAFPKTSYGGYSNCITDMRRSLSVPPSSTVNASLPQPPLPISGAGINVYIDGSKQDTKITPNFASHCQSYYGQYSYQKEGFVMSSRSINRDELSDRLGQNIMIVRSEVPVAQWSENWLSYTCYDGIILTGPEIKAMPEAVRTALWSYVKCGGFLVIMGGYDIPRPWSEMKDNSVSGMDSYNAGFGICAVTKTLDVKAITSEGMEYMKNIFRRSLSLWLGFDDLGVIKNFAVKENIGVVNVRNFMLLIFAFAVISGPVNYFILLRKKKKIWMLWTVPCISFFTCLTIFLYSVFSEGFGSYLRTEGFTLLDERSHEAVTMGMTGFYSPLTPGQGLFFSSCTEATSMTTANKERYGYSYAEKGTSRTIDWTSGQHLKSGWITARVPSYFVLRKSEIRRERLQVNYDNGIPMVLNGLGAGIKKLWVIDKEGRVFSGKDIPAGGSSVLNAMAGLRMKSAGPSLYNNIFTGFFSGPVNSMEKWFEDPVSGLVLCRNTYIAILDAFPFIENGLKDADNVKTRGIVLGIMGE